MNQYVKNAGLFVRGIAWLWTLEARLVDRDEHGEAVRYFRYTRGDLTGDRVLDYDRFIHYKRGWGPWKFLPIYLLDHGIACVVLGLGVQPISRWAGLRDHQPWRWLARLLNRIDDGHTDSARYGLLWGSQPCRDRTRYLVMAAWVTVALAAVWL